MQSVAIFVSLKMTKQDFIEYVSHPENLNGQSIGALEKLVHEYPYFQLGRMLYLKNLHNENSIAYEKNLHITSAYAPSGKVLYNLIKKKAQKEKVVGHPNLVIQPTFAAPQAVIDNKPKLEPIVVLLEMPMDTETHPAATEVNRNDEWDLLEKEMLREAYRTSMTINLFEGERNEGKKPTYDKAAEPGTQNLIPKAFGTETAAYSFGDWMKLVNSKGPELATNLSNPASSQLVSTKPTKSTQESIIDNFILEQASKTPPKPKAEFYKAENMAKKSIQDDENFVSETLARIYLKQGNLPKALRAYEILLVKHPEKLHIFAPLLEKIKKLMEDQKAR